MHTFPNMVKIVEMNLLQIKRKFIKNCLILGKYKETMNTLIEKGYKCILVSDCTAARNQKLQNKIEAEFELIPIKFQNEL